MTKYFLRIFLFEVFLLLITVVGVHGQTADKIDLISKWDRLASRADQVVERSQASNETLKIILSDLSSILGKISHHATITPAVIIIGKVVNNYYTIQECLKNIPSNVVQPLGDLGFDIWKSTGIDA